MTTTTQPISPTTPALDVQDLLLMAQSLSSGSLMSKWDINLQARSPFDADAAKTPYLDEDHNQALSGDEMPTFITHRLSTTLYQTGLAPFHCPLDLLHRETLGLSSPPHQDTHLTSDFNACLPSIVNALSEARLTKEGELSASTIEDRRGFTLIEMILCVVIGGF